MESKKNINILLGVSGGIAAYKIPSLVRALKKKDGHFVKVLLTETATKLVAPLALQTVSENPVYTDSESFYDMDHIRLADWADIFLVAPATANTIAKFACGIADNLISSVFLSFDGPKIIAPAMNARMWRNIATQENVKTLKQRGVKVTPVEKGFLACGDIDEGRMLSVDTLARMVVHADVPSILSGKKVLISSGSTSEPIDPVRVITNRSSGRMGSELAVAALMMGAEVTVVSGAATFPLPDGIKKISVTTADEMKNAIEDNFAECDICIMAAAVSDYRVSDYSDEKIPRTDIGLSLNLSQNPDILASLCKHKKNQVVVGFSLETGDGLTRAKEKMIRKGCDLMVYNRASDALGTSNSEIAILTSFGENIDNLGKLSKSDSATLILQKAFGELSNGR